MTSFPLREIELESSVKTKIKTEKKEGLSSQLLEEEIKKDKINERAFIKSDPWASAIISLYLNNIINPKIEDEHVKEFFEHYENYGYGIKHIIHRKIIPIQKRGYKWEDMPSRNLRRRFRTKADELISMVSQFSEITVKNFSIDAKFVYNEEFISDQFGDVSAFSMKKSKKRKDERSGISLLFNKSFIKNKESNMIFFSSSIDEKHHNEWQSSSYLLEKIFKIVQDYRGKGSNGKEIIKQFLLSSNYEIANLFNHKSSVFFGLKNGKDIEYINWGDINLYVYDGKEFNLIDKGEDIYLGTAVQVIKGRGGKRVIDLLHPEMIKIRNVNVDGAIAVLIASSNLDSIIRGKRKMRFKNAQEFIEKLKKKASKSRKNGDSGAIMFFL